MKVAIVGTAGVPAAYGGFETLAENIVRFSRDVFGSKYSITVFCSGSGGETWCDAELVHIRLPANGIFSILYDIVSLVIALYKRVDVILILGVSGAIFIPVVKLVSRAKVVVNVDGIEWRRAKWGRFASRFLKVSERIALRFADAVIADNPAVKKYLEAQTRRACHLIAYGGDHALVEPFAPNLRVPGQFYFSVCRIEPENNVDMILRAFLSNPLLSIVFVGNWSASAYGVETRAKFSGRNNIFLLDPIYDIRVLSYFRTNAVGYIHGHSAGGTNPSLVEAMHFGRPIFAYDCSFNRETTQEHAHFFSDHHELLSLLGRHGTGEDSSGETLKEIAQANFTWQHVAKMYFSLFDNMCQSPGHYRP